MTPYVVTEENHDKSPTKPNMNGSANGDLLHKSSPNGDIRSSTVEPRRVEGKPPTPLKNRNGTGALVNGKGIRPSSACNGGKPGRTGGGLKRVSFGSSKGSMVETLIYDHHEEIIDHQPSFTVVPFIEIKGGDDTSLKQPSKVRVTFFESQKPNFVTTPDSPDIPFDFISNFMPNMTSPTSPERIVYGPQDSVDSGRDNPFRPDGELSREAETIVNLIKEGKPITPTPSEDADDYNPSTTPDQATQPDGVAEKLAGTWI